MIRKDAVYRVAMVASRIFVRYRTFTPAGAPKLGSFCSRGRVGFPLLMVHDGGMLSLPNSLPPARHLMVLPSSSSAVGKLASEFTHNKKIFD